MSARAFSHLLAAARVVSGLREAARASHGGLRRAVAAVMVGTALALVGCGDKPAFMNVDITGASQFGTDFALADTNGHVRTLADFKGKVVVLFFGYLHCPDVCPTTMAELAQAMQQLGDQAKRVQVLFVTLDPKRDSAPLLAQYVAAFNPSFIGLRPANDVQLSKVTKSFRVYYAKEPGKDGADYTVDHTAASYVFDPAGKLRLFARDGQGSMPWVHDIKLLLD
ncbi:protein SCO1/2 [Burkholderia sp. b14]|nr:protein SCO1/2 [Burkholderia sp. b14]